MRISDWSADVCSSDLRWPRPISGAAAENPGLRRSPRLILRTRAQTKAVRRNGGLVDRKSVVSGTSVSVRVDLGGRRISKKTMRKQLKQGHQACIDEHNQNGPS